MFQWRRSNCPPTAARCAHGNDADGTIRSNRGESYAAAYSAERKGNSCSEKLSRLVIQLPTTEEATQYTWENANAETRRHTAETPANISMVLQNAGVSNGSPGNRKQRAFNSSFSYKPKPYVLMSGVHVLSTTFRIDKNHYEAFPNTWVVGTKKVGQSIFLCTTYRCRHISVVPTAIPLYLLIAISVTVHNDLPSLSA